MERKGEPLVSNFTSLPKDARLVLEIREKVSQQLKNEPPSHPVRDLEIEHERDDLMALNRQVSNPLAFMLPSSLLKLLTKAFRS